MPNKKIDLHPSWLNVIGDEFDKPYMQKLKAFLTEQKKQGKTIYPAGENIFNALNTTPLDKVKVVILGQDPYHGPGQAHGLSFSVPIGVKIPPSLVNIYKEIRASTNIEPPNHGCLQKWAENGILLLNATLTVEARNAGSHQKKGWEQFTDAIIQAINNHTENVTFMLWGGYAQKRCHHQPRQTYHTDRPSPIALISIQRLFRLRPLRENRSKLIKVVIRAA